MKILVEVAALNSAPLDPGRDHKELDTWVRSLNEKEKGDLLLTALSEQGERRKIALLRRFEKRTSISCPPRPPPGNAPCPSCCWQPALAQKREEARPARRKAEDEAKRAQYLNNLSNGKQ
jgi:hypothetical protein